MIKGNQKYFNTVVCRRLHYAEDCNTESGKCVTTTSIILWDKQEVTKSCTQGLEISMPKCMEVM